MSPYTKSDATPPELGLHSHSPLRQTTLPMSRSFELAGSDRNRESLESSMPPPPLPAYVQERHSALASPDLTNDPFVDSQSVRCTRTQELLKNGFDASSTTDRPSSRASVRNITVEPIIPQLFSMPLEEQVRRLRSNSETQNEPILFARPEGMTILNAPLYAKAGELLHHYSPAGGHRTLGPPFMESATRPLGSINGIPHPESAVRSLEDDCMTNQDGAQAQPGTRHGLAFDSLLRATTNEAAEVLGERPNNQIPLDSPISTRNGKGRSTKSATPAKVAGEKRKRPATGAKKSRKNSSADSTPLSSRKVAKT